MAVLVCFLSSVISLMWDSSEEFFDESFIFIFIFSVTFTHLTILFMSFFYLTFSHSILPMNLSLPVCVMR